MLRPKQIQIVEQKHPFELQVPHYPAPAPQWIVCHLDYIPLVPIQQHHTTRMKRSKKNIQTKLVKNIKPHQNTNYKIRKDNQWAQSIYEVTIIQEPEHNESMIDLHLPWWLFLFEKKNTCATEYLIKQLLSFDLSLQINKKKSEVLGEIYSLQLGKAPTCTWERYQVRVSPQWV